MQQKTDDSWHRRHQHFLAPMATLLAAVVALGAAIFGPASATRYAARMAQGSALIQALESQRSSDMQTLSTANCHQHPSDNECSIAKSDLPKVQQRLTQLVR